MLVLANVVPSSPIIVTLMEALSSSETSILTRATWRNIPEDAILHSHRSENLKSYIVSGLMIGCTELLQLLNRSEVYAVTVLHTSYITTGHILGLHSLLRFLAVAL
jgi:hypothetical protein